MNYGFGEASFEYFESCNFSHENTNIDVSVFMFDLRMINMSSEYEYDWYWKISACSTEYEVCDSFASLTCQQTSYSGSAGWYFRYQSIHIQITYTNTYYVLVYPVRIWECDWYHFETRPRKVEIYILYKSKVILYHGTNNTIWNKMWYLPGQ